MSGSGAVVVWEWESQPRIWVPYTANVCQHIESEFRRQCQKVDLSGQNVVELAGCEIDFARMKQVNLSNNDCAKVRRQLYPSDSPLANGVNWKWFADFRWQFYDVETSNYIEDAFQNKKKKVSLQRSPIRIPNTIYFSQMVQMNKTTKFPRKIERVETKDKYPQANYATTNMNGQHGLSQVSNPISPGLRATVIKHGSTTSANAPNTRTPNPLAPTSASTQTGLNNLNSPFNPVRPKMNSNMNPIHYPNSPTGSTVNRRGRQNGLTMHNTVPLHHMGGLPPSSYMPSIGNAFGPPRLQTNTSNSNYGASYLGSSTQTSGSPAAALTQASSLPTRKRQRDAFVSSPVPTSTRSVSGPLGDFARSVQSGIKLDDECAICLESLSTPSDYDNDPNADVQCTSADVLELIKCKHMFHRICLKRLHESSTSQNGCLRCPTCKTIHGIMKGNQPDGGTMTVTNNARDIPGYPGCGSIVIVYQFTSGTQGPNHPNPGQRYHPNAFPRTCYLPNNDKGKKVLRLLRIAFDRQLVFTVGRSVTTGQENCIVWNDIHHKTEGYGNGSGYGYPDPNYLDNVLAELASHGVTDDV